jgi:hypothetical protein
MFAADVRGGGSGREGRRTLTMFAAAATVVVVVVVVCLPAAASSNDADCVTALGGERICEPRRPRRAATGAAQSQEAAAPGAARSAPGAARSVNGDPDTDHTTRFLEESMEVLDWEARVFKVKNFLSDDEVDALLELGRGTLDEQFGDEWRAKHAYATVFFTNAQYKRSKVLQAFEERVARLTMVKGHADEAPSMFTRQIPGTPAGKFIPDQVLRNVHHDKNQRENRVVTVLVYLSSARDGDGGHTLFPCLPARRGDKSGRKVAEQMARDFRRLFDNGTRVIDTNLKSEFEMDLFKRCNAQCHLAHRSQVLSVKPVKGTAVVFWSVEADGFPNHDVWHSACQALAGGERYALQKFKELPRVSGEWVLHSETGKPQWKPLPGKKLEL